MLTSVISHCSCGKGIISCELGELHGCFNYHFPFYSKMYWNADEEIILYYMEKSGIISNLFKLLII